MLLQRVEELERIVQNLSAKILSEDPEPQTADSVSPV
jgi:hypothetical protein